MNIGPQTAMQRLRKILFNSLQREALPGPVSPIQVVVRFLAIRREASDDKLAANTLQKPKINDFLHYCSQTRQCEMRYQRILPDRDTLIRRGRRWL